MRHKKKFNHLGRKRGHRKAMLSNMAASLILHKRIKTTTAKAKALKMVIEPVITRAKEDTTHSRREAFKLLQDKEAVTELFREVAVKVADRPGGYTRIIKLGARFGDNAEMCIFELVDYNENMLAEKAAASKSRRRRGGKKKSHQVEASTEAAVKTENEAAVEVADEEASEETAEAVVEEAVAEEPVAEDAVAEDAVSEEPVAEDAVAEDKKVEEAPAAEKKEDAPAEEVKEAPSAEATEAKEEPKAEAEEVKEAPSAEATEAKEEPKAKDDEEKKAE